MASTIDLLMGVNGPPIEIDHDVRLTREMNVKAYEYWKRVKGDRRMPSRKDITPQAMREFIRHIGLVEIRTGAHGEQTYFVRLAGDKIESVYGSITGKFLSEFLPPQIEARWRTIFSAPQGTKAPVRFASRVAFGGRDYLANELLAAPLGEGEEVSMIFVSVDIWPAVGAEPGKPRTA